MRQHLASSLLLIPLLTASMPTPVPIAIRHSVVALEGPWRFHTGDDSRWADPAFDDGTWETVDLTPAPGSHDPDVGLPGYVSGWGARGHRGYSGYAWYRMHVSVTASPGDTLALAGPLEVNDAYEMFVDGQRLGGAGDFVGARPVVYNTRPLMFVLSHAPNVVAVRVWTAPGTMRGDSTAGGMRIAPAIGQVGTISARHQLEWLKKFTGYVVDAVLALAFLLLAVMAVVLVAFDPADPAYRWLVLALVLYALRRANQAVFFWMPFESLALFNLVTNVLLTPLVLGSWAMTWRQWFRLRSPEWIGAAIAVLTLLYVLAQLAHFTTFALTIRLCFVLVFVLTVYQSVQGQWRERLLDLAAVLLIAVALFASELSLANVSGIWFPYGTGVSRTQYALAGFAVVMFALLLRRLLALGNDYRTISRSKLSIRAYNVAT